MAQGTQTTTLTVRGINDLNAVLKALPYQFEEDVLRFGLIAGARVLQKEIARVSPRYKTSGPMRLHKNIRTQRRRKRYKQRLEGKVTPTTFRGAKVRAGVPHAHLVEFGHGGPKPAPAHPFMRPALHRMSNQMLAAIVQECRRRWATLALVLSSKYATKLSTKDILRVSEITHKSR